MSDEKIENLFEGTLSIISIDLPYKNAMPDSQRKPFNF